MTHYSSNDILELARLREDGYREVTLELAQDDTCDAPGSTKWNLAGPGSVHFLIHPTGWQATPGETITRRYK